MNPLARANRFSWWAAAALAALALLTYLLSPRIPGLSQWQLQSGFKNLTGYLLLALLVGMWLPTWLRQRFNRPTQLDWIKLSHQWLGVGFLAVLVLHANLLRSGFLALQTLVLLVLCSLGAAIVWAQLNGSIVRRRWWITTHIVLAFVASGFVLMHLYFVYAYHG